jgi:predicted hotdog family 3-hydroxylacyl-ACP dehydratase
MLNHEQIEALIPHRGAMCLLDRLVDWSADRIVCVATGHVAPDNPLRTASGLSATVAIEYAAQAMALHGALLAREGGGEALPGFLASARGVKLHRLRLDDLAGLLEVEATRQAGDAKQLLYAFTLKHSGSVIAEGRVAVVLGVALSAAPVAQSGA